MGKRIYIILILAAVIILAGRGIKLSFAQAPPVEKDEIIFTTYYPAPYGVYNEMRAKQMAVGEGYNDPATVQFPVTPT